MNKFDLYNYAIYALQVINYTLFETGLMER